MLKLIDGSTVPEDSLSFDPATYHFTATGRGDITNLIYRRDKIRLVPDFDVERENFRLSSEQGSGGGLGLDPLEENTAKILLDQLATDPLGAPLDALNRGVNQLLSAPGVIKLAVIGGIGLAAYLMVKKA